MVEKIPIITGRITGHSRRDRLRGRGDNTNTPASTKRADISIQTGVLCIAEGGTRGIAYDQREEPLYA
jgi:hypothetical protein